MIEAAIQQISQACDSRRCRREVKCAETLNDAAEHSSDDGRISTWIIDIHSGEVPMGSRKVNITGKSENVGINDFVESIKAEETHL